MQEIPIIKITPHLTPIRKSVNYSGRACFVQGVDFQLKDDRVVKSTVEGRRKKDVLRNVERQQAAASRGEYGARSQSRFCALRASTSDCARFRPGNRF